ncbi:MAG: right-handed parallel beta-helix repeat-containing protein [Candidatus Anammoximicrobium sp.]|nr:right-handed parallel beta-helix repeat-containing protein [Candidatus Anammoximicrobium sp.]
MNTSFRLACLGFACWNLIWVTAAVAGPATLYVAVDGNDAWSGKLPEANATRTDGPLATLEAARDAVRRWKQAGPLPARGVVVELRGGVYERDRALELTAEDSGAAETPIEYRARPGESVRLIGGKRIAGFTPVTDGALLGRLEPETRGNVWQVDLRAAGVTDFGGPAGGGLELFFQGRPMHIARWPNDGFVKIVHVQGPTPVDIRGTRGCREGVFSYEGDRPRRWKDEKDLWLHGYWFWDWADQRQKVASIDVDKRLVTLVPPNHSYGYRNGQWFYAFNALAEIDQPGEWYLDRETGTLYFWPPAPIASGEALVSVVPTLVSCQDTAYVTIRGLTFEAMRSTAVVVRGGSHNRLVGCTIRNGGRNAVSVTGTANGVIGCEIDQMAEGGISLSGGDRKSLAPAGLYAENNHIHHYGRVKPMYSAGISVHGVGNRIAHNLIHDAPHQAIGFGGNDHVIELNEIHNVCFESNDAGAIYAGRDWTMRGTVIRHNYLHHIYGFERRGCVGVYLDDMYCGTEISGNVFYQVPRAAFIGGGRDCQIVNNVFVDCKPAVHVDARALGWARDHADGWIREGRERGTLSGIRFREPPYSDRYPPLVPILDEDPAAPRGNVVARNICWGGRWDEIEGKARPLVKLEHNLLDQDPRFVNAASLNFQLRPDSPAWKLGFQRIPIERIGLVGSPDRAPGAALPASSQTGLSPAE